MADLQQHPAVARGSARGHRRRPEARAAPKPTWIFEGRYEAYYRNNYKPEQWGEWQVRFQAYQSVFAGGFGFTYGA